MIMTDNEIVKHCTEKNALSFNDIKVYLLKRYDYENI